MQPSAQLVATLDRLATPERALFTTADLSSALPRATAEQLAVTLSRMVKRGSLVRVCRGVYLYPRAKPDPRLILPRTAARLRAGHAVYLSLESVLSQHGIISQIPMRLTLMTSGRRGEIDCGSYGTIEFTHTKRRPEDWRGQLTYNPSLRLWVASAALAWQDLQHVGRNLDLVDHDVFADALAATPAEPPTEAVIERTDAHL